MTTTTAPPLIDRYSLRFKDGALPFKSLAEASKVTGLTPSAIWRVWTEETSPSAVMVGTILRTTGRPFDEMFEVIPDPSRRPRRTA